MARHVAPTQTQQPSLRYHCRSLCCSLRDLRHEITSEHRGSCNDSAHQRSRDAETHHVLPGEVHVADRRPLKTIDKKTLGLLLAYRWPGNIRELQNVIERAVILCDGETFSVDETWLRRELPVARNRPSTMSRALARQEKEMIEAALSESYGQVSGRSGAATKLGLPARTLDSKIKRFRINKYRFKVQRAR
jgi:DNA-binding NtrC family response regulator